MTLAVAFVFEADLAKIDLMLELKMPLRGADPNGARRRGQALQRPLEKLPIIVRWRDVGFGEACHLIEEAVDLFSRFLNQLHVDLGVGLNAHCLASRVKDSKESEGRADGE
jgi:hypothetical protein